MKATKGLRDYIMTHPSIVKVPCGREGKDWEGRAPLAPPDPPFKKPCPKCKGSYQGASYDGADQKKVDCFYCDHGEIWNYLTPRQWEEKTLRTMREDDPVWIICWVEGTKSDLNRKRVILDTYANSKFYYNKNKRVFVARAGQPRPTSKEGE